MADPDPIPVTRRIAAPAAAIFTVPADPARHPEFDGTGMLSYGLEPRPIRRTGEEFTTAMHNDHRGRYEMTNRVVAYEPDLQAELAGGRVWVAAMTESLEMLAALFA